MLNHLNPLLKILFIITQIVFLLAYHNTILLISVLVILALSLFLYPQNLIFALNTLLRAAPLLLSIVILGYIFANPWKKDVMIIGLLMFTISYTVVFVRTTSSYIFLGEINKLSPRRFREAATLFVYGIIRFLPIIYSEYTHTINVYKYRVNRKLNLSAVTDMFPLIVNRSLREVHQCSRAAVQLSTCAFPRSFHTCDLIFPVLLLVQVGLIIL